MSKKKYKIKTKKESKRNMNSQINKNQNTYNSYLYPYDNKYNNQIPTYNDDTNNIDNIDNIENTYNEEILYDLEEYDNEDNKCIIEKNKEGYRINTNYEDELCNMFQSKNLNLSSDTKNSHINYDYNNLLNLAENNMLELSRYYFNIMRSSDNYMNIHIDFENYFNVTFIDNIEMNQLYNYLSENDNGKNMLMKIVTEQTVYHTNIGYVDELLINGLIDYFLQYIEKSFEI